MLKRKNIRRYLKAKIKIFMKIETLDEDKTKEEACSKD